MAAREEPCEVQGRCAGEDEADDRTQSCHGDHESEPDAERLVWILQAQPKANVWHTGRLDTPPAPKPAAQAAEAAGDRQGARGGSDTLAECLLCRSWVVQLAGGP